MVRRAAVALCVAATVLLSACSGPSIQAGTTSNGGSSSKGKSGAGPTEDASTPPKSKKPAPAMPKAAKTHEDFGAGVFVKHYVDLHNYALSTGNTAPVTKLSADDCVPCKQMIPPPPARLEGGAWSATGRPSFEVDKDLYTAKVYLKVKVAPAKFYKDSSAKPRELPGRDSTLAVTLKWKGSTWQVAAFGQI